MDCGKTVTFFHRLYSHSAGEIYTNVALRVHELLSRNVLKSQMPKSANEANAVAFNTKHVENHIKTYK